MLEIQLVNLFNVYASMRDHIFGAYIAKKQDNYIVGPELTDA